jgi:superfamily II DNA or RNA helicase
VSSLVGVGKTLRPYQRRAIELAREAYRKGKRAVLLVCPTGGGKTLVASRIVENAVKRSSDTVYWLAHREELLMQAQRSIMAEGIQHVGIIAPWARRQHATVQVASVQTLAAQVRKGNALPKPRLVIVDEAHHFSSGAPGWFEVVKALGSPTLIGLTATPERGDGSPMGDLFDELIEVTTVRELQGLGVLVPCVTYAPETKTKALVREPIDAYREHGWGERAVVFCVTIAHAEMIAETFRLAGVPAATIHERTPWDLRRARLKSFEMQDPTPLRRVGNSEEAPLVLCNVQCLTEGWDCPAASVCITAKGIGHAGMMRQMVGRVLRASPGKARAIWWDLRGQSHKPKIGLPESDCTYSLEGKAIVVKADIDDKPMQCACGAKFFTWAVDRATGRRLCPECREPAPALELPEVSEREVFAMGSGADEDSRRQAIDRIAIDAVQRGRKPGWMFHRYRDLYQQELPWKEIDASMAKARDLLGVRVAAGEVDAERARLQRIAVERGIPAGWVEKKLMQKFGAGAAA